MEQRCNLNLTPSDRELDDEINAGINSNKNDSSNGTGNGKRSKLQQWVHEINNFVVDEVRTVRV